MPSTSKLKVHNGKITIEELKQISREFDVESIHSLNLCSRGLNDLTDLSYCVGLERLDLSNNKLCRLQWLEPLKNITHLNLSQNDLSNLESLRNLENLKILDVSGNSITSFDSILCLKHASLLNDLTFKSNMDALSNPICSNPSYPDYILEILPQIQYLDRSKVRGVGSEFFYSVKNLLQTDDNEKQTKSEKSPSKNLIEVPLIGDSGSSSSLVSQFVRELNERSDADDLMDEAMLKFRQLVDECNDLCEKSEEKIEWAHSQMANN